jgi:hypothetical protein
VCNNKETFDEYLYCTSLVIYVTEISDEKTNLQEMINKIDQNIENKIYTDLIIVINDTIKNKYFDNMYEKMFPGWFRTTFSFSFSSLFVDTIKNNNCLLFIDPVQKKELLNILYESRTLIPQRLLNDCKFYNQLHKIIIHNQELINLNDFIENTSESAIVFNNALIEYIKLCQKNIVDIILNQLMNTWTSFFCRFILRPLGEEYRQRRYNDFYIMYKFAFDRFKNNVLFLHYVKKFIDTIDSNLIICFPNGFYFRFLMIIYQHALKNKMNELVKLIFEYIISSNNILIDTKLFIFEYTIINKPDDSINDLIENPMYVTTVFSNNKCFSDNLVTHFYIIDDDNQLTITTDKKFIALTENIKDHKNTPKLLRYFLELSLVGERYLQYMFNSMKLGMSVKLSILDKNLPTKLDYYLNHRSDTLTLEPLGHNLFNGFLSYTDVTMYVKTLFIL